MKQPPLKRPFNDTSHHSMRSFKNTSHSSKNVGFIDSVGPEGRVRGTARQICEKYQSLAKDALFSGDPVAAEGFFQHAEHYGRIMEENKQQKPFHEHNKRPARPSKAFLQATPLSPKKSSDEETPPPQLS